MQAHNNNIEGFLGNFKTTFVVPVYQRNYDWKKNNCEQLFKDIIAIEPNKEHFLGTICFKLDNSRKRLIIDGQQRITSITLLLKVVCDYTSDKNIRDEINSQYIYNNGFDIDNDFLRFKLHLNKRDDIIYHILLENTKDTVDDKLTVLQKNSHIYQNYLYFYDMVDAFVKKGGKVEDILRKLRYLTIVELEIQQENPQEIFESLNSTGLDLTNVDLLRNFILMQFSHDEQSELYEKYWSKIEDAIGVDGMERFFTDFLVFERRSDSIMINGRSSHINERNLYTSFKNYYAEFSYNGNFNKTLEFFAELKACADLYKNFVFSDDVNLNKETKIRKKLYFLLTIDDSSKARSLLLYIFDLYNRKLISEDMLVEAVDAISSLTFRAKLCKAQGIKRQFAGSVMQRLDQIIDYNQFVEQFWQSITIGRGSFAFPSDAEFINALVNKDLYQTLRSKGTKYLLYMLELNSSRPKGLPSFDDVSITIEHIMPQTLSERWKKYLTKETMESYESSLHRLGNLALTNYNGEMSNKDFEDKKEVYKDSKFYYTTRITEYDKWQISEINKRSQALAKEACKIWKLPAKFQKKKATTESLHTLSEDTSQFAYTKPAMLTIGNEEFVVNSWFEFIPILCKLLAKDNYIIFSDVVSPDKMLCFKFEDGTHDYANNKSFIHIIDNLYMVKGIAASDIIEKMAKIAEEYDNMAGTDFYGSILFSLK